MLSNVSRYVDGLLGDFGKKGARGRTVICLCRCLKLVREFLPVFRAVQTVKEPSAAFSISGDIQYSDALTGGGFLTSVFANLVSKRYFAARQKEQRQLYDFRAEPSRCARDFPVLFASI